jgi:acyl phosphate:glycerol-3-phosphate acyltransferase
VDYLDIASVITGYLLGSFPSAYIAGRMWKGIDVRQVGSRNMGAMNTFGHIGKTAGAAVFIVDVGKGIAAIFIARAIGTSELTGLAAGLAAALGHRFPVFLNFRGGKAGAITLGILFLLMPKGIPFFAAVTLLLFLLTRNLPFSYIIAFFCFTIVGWLMYSSPGLSGFSLALTLFVMINHYSMIRDIRDKGFRKAIIRSALK